MNKVNASQQKAINIIDGPLLIIAGPGTGKTFTIVERVMHMVIDLGIEPRSILLSTFTNKATDELFDRLSSRFQKEAPDKDVNDMFLGNFHRICSRILDENLDLAGLTKGYEILDEYKRSYFIYKKLPYFRKIRGYFDLVGENEVKNIEKILDRIFENAILDRASVDHRMDTMLKIVDTYERLLAANNALDFSCILFKCYRLLKDHAQVADYYRASIDHILIDEYQDTNVIQEKILRLLLNENENICVVGDDDQGLYRFRGASVENILKFGQDLKKPVQRVDLDINYRSKADIVDFYQAFMGGLDTYVKDLDKYRFRKDLKAARPGDEKRVFRLNASSDEGYNKACLDLVKSLLKGGHVNKLSDICFLVSSINDSRVLSLISFLKKEGVKAHVTGTNTLMSRTETSELIGFLYLIFRKYIDKNKLTIVGVNSPFMQKAVDRAYKLTLKDEGLKDFVARMADYILSEQLNLSLKDIIYRLFAYEPFYSYFEDTENNRKSKNLSKLIDVISSFTYVNKIKALTSANAETFIKSFFSDFIDFIKEMRIREFEVESEDCADDEVNFMTIHSSKGMEFPVVVMASLWDWISTSRVFPLDMDLERLMVAQGIVKAEPKAYENSLDFFRKYYTGFSRAKDLLILAPAQNVSNNIKPFFKRLPVFDLSMIKTMALDPTAKTRAKASYAFTVDLAVYDFCHRRYYLERVLRLKGDDNKALLLGSVTHELIEGINKSLIKGIPVSEDDLLDKAKHIAAAKRISSRYDIFREDLDKVVAEGKAYLKDLGLFHKILESEKDILLAKEGYMLKGTVDMVYENASGLHIVDLKTGTVAYREGQALVDRNYIDQIRLYGHMLAKSRNKPVKDVTLYFIGLNNKEKIFTYDYSSDQDELILKKVDRIVSEIEADEEFSKTHDEKKCKYCMWKYMCKRV